jgi:hypothetical protein
LLKAPRALNSGKHWEKWWQKGGKHVEIDKFKEDVHVRVSQCFTVVICFELVFFGRFVDVWCWNTPFSSIFHPINRSQHGGDSQW